MLRVSVVTTAWRVVTLLMEGTAFGCDVGGCRESDEQEVADN
jgi:hypothetical protein